MAHGDLCVCPFISELLRAMMGDDDAWETLGSGQRQRRRGQRRGPGLGVQGGDRRGSRCARSQTPPGPRFGAAAARVQPPHWFSDPSARRSPGECVRPLAPYLWGRICPRGPSRTPRFWPLLVSPLSSPSPPRHPAGSGAPSVTGLSGLGAAASRRGGPAGRGRYPRHHADSMMRTLSPKVWPMLLCSKLK